MGLTGHRQQTKQNDEGENREGEEMRVDNKDTLVRISCGQE